MDNTDNSFTVSRAQLVYGLTLPLAALLGFFLAEPTGSNAFVIFCVLGALFLPLLMRWYHPLLVVSWNAVMFFPFLPGSPPWWLLLVVVGCFIIVLNRCVGSRLPLMNGGAVPKALLLFALVVAVTALLTGGAGIRALGGTSFGGKRYVFIAGAILGYFVLVSRPIPPNRGLLYVGLFFLSAITSGLTAFVGRVPWLGFILPFGEAVSGDEFMMGSGVVRLMTLGTLSVALCTFLLVWYGMRGLLDFSRPWRFCFLAASFGICLLSGFRSSLLVLVAVFAGVFFLEGLHRSRHLWFVMGALVLLAVGLVKFSADLPLSVQRSISFLPVEINPIALSDARDSVEWRTEMWRSLMPQVREHFWLGKGYALSPDDLYMASVDEFTGFGMRSQIAATAGDYHSGPLSLLIPFGVWGGLAFAIFLYVSIRRLYHYCTEGRPEFQNMNRVLLACFAARTLSFLFIVGAVHVDLPYLIGVVAIAVALNEPSVEPETASEDPEFGAVETYE